ncbi:hypothetical protein HZA99_00070 [Candidatus Woesearchaeota archaeon]|nr:hypothetical protein [Candidatus Woesearchaeota archaeon]
MTVKQMDALIRFDKKKIANHQCLFAFLCKIHPELELSWDFFEKIRTKRRKDIKRVSSFSLSWNSSLTQQTLLRLND